MALEASPRRNIRRERMAYLHRLAVISESEAAQAQVLLPVPPSLARVFPELAAAVEARVQQDHQPEALGFQELVITAVLASMHHRTTVLVAAVDLVAREVTAPQRLPAMAALELQIPSLGVASLVAVVGVVVHKEGPQAQAAQAVGETELVITQPAGRAVSIRAAVVAVVVRPAVMAPMAALADPAS